MAVAPTTESSSGLDAPHAVTSRLTAHYDACLARHGATAAGMDWGPDPNRLEARYDAVLRLVAPPPDRPWSLTDVGCGCGLLLTSLRRRGVDVHYQGVDASPAMIEAARLAHPDASFLVGDAGTPEHLPEADWVVANGLLTERRGIDLDTMHRFADACLRSMWSRCRVGLVFNVMSRHVNWETEDLYHRDPGDLLDWLCRNLSRHVTIAHDLPTHDFFCCVRRRPAGATSR